MTDTYTFTARNVDDYDRVVTFTLYGENLRVNYTGTVEKLEKISQADEKRAEAKHQIIAGAEPTTMKLAQRVSGPVHVSDVNVNLDEGKFQLLAWQRLGGLRLAPVWINVGSIDNVEAAEAFVDELASRKKEVDHAGKFFGPLDYWAGWASLLLAIVILMRWPEKRQE